MFATNKKMHLHYRNDHGNREIENMKTDIYACPIKDCLKEYKTQG